MLAILTIFSISFTILFSIYSSLYFTSVLNPIRSSDSIITSTSFSLSW